jgi:hypothetical protein
MKRLLAVDKLEQVLTRSADAASDRRGDGGRARSRRLRDRRGVRARVVVIDSATPDTPVSPPAPDADYRSPRASRARPAGGSVPIGNAR